MRLDVGLLVLALIVLLVAVYVLYLGADYYRAAAELYRVGCGPAYNLSGNWSW